MQDAVSWESFLAAYAKWHYKRGLQELFSSIGESLCFVARYFSLGHFHKSLSKLLMNALGSIVYAVCLLAAALAALIWLLAPVALLGSAALSAIFFIL